MLYVSFRDAHQVLLGWGNKEGRDGRAVHTGFCGKAGRKPLGRPRRRWGIMLKLTLKEEQEGVDWTDVAQDRDKRRDVVITVMNRRVSWIAGNFFTGWVTVSFSGVTLLSALSFSGHFLPMTFTGVQLRLWIGLLILNCVLITWVYCKSWILSVSQRLQYMGSQTARLHFQQMVILTHSEKPLTLLEAWKWRKVSLHKTYTTVRQPAVCGQRLVPIAFSLALPSEWRAVLSA